jgi:hypothetical protein
MIDQLYALFPLLCTFFTTPTQVLQYTTDNAGLGPVTAGSLPEVYTVVDFGPGVLPSLAFPLQKA